MILDDILKNFRKYGQDIAYRSGNESYTYLELYKFVCNIYNYLLKENKDKRPVIIYGHKQIYMKATFLACSYAGMAYVPIDSSMPEERIKQIIEQVKPRLIVGDLQCINLHKEIYKIVFEQEIRQVMNLQNFSEINQIYMKPEDIYYIIFTSGSTGTPKGVKVTYSNLNSCINWLKEGIEKGVILNQANFSFDLSVADLYLSLITGSCHYILEKNDFASMFKELKQSRTSVAILTPSFADLLLLDKSFSQNLLPKLTKIYFCGEKLSKRTIEKLFERFENIEIVNCYGPTECTFAVTKINISKKEINNMREIPVGFPKKDVDIYIVDENLKQLLNNECGEILITGESVADGYLGKNNQKAFVEYNGKKGYLTGDIGYYKDGILYFKERKDKQIKYKGYRIELSDIEKNIESLTYVERAVVVCKKDEDGKVLNIIAFVKTEYSKEQLKQDLKLRLPGYMMPKIKIIKEFPINNNGKCDERKLLEEY